MPQPAASSHQAVAECADHQLAMNGPGDGLQIVLGVLLAKDVAVVRVDEHIEFATFLLHHELRTAPGFERRQVLFDMAQGIRGPDPLELLIGAEHVVPRRHLQQVAVHQRVELGFEQVDDPGQGQHHHERGHEQPGVEMPAPGQVVERHFRLAHQGTLRMGNYSL
ncbi:hypothetical protein ACVWZ9_002572 [Pseudomonas chlororaphis]